MKGCRCCWNRKLLATVPDYQGYPTLSTWIPGDGGLFMRPFVFSIAHLSTTMDNGGVCTCDIQH